MNLDKKSINKLNDSWEYIDSRSAMFKELERKAEMKLKIIGWVLVIVCIGILILAKYLLS